MCKAVKELREEGFQEGTNILSALIQKMYSMYDETRAIEEIRRIVTDTEYRDKLLAEYGLYKEESD